MTEVIKYLPMRNFHIIPIKNLNPDEIKKSAEECKQKYKDREEIKLTTIQNFIAKSLGIKGGFSEYKKEYEEKLVVFMKENNLINQVNVLENNCKFSRFTYKQLADKLFSYQLNEMPVKIFTGHNINDRDYDALHFYYYDDDEKTIEYMKLNSMGRFPVFGNFKAERRTNIFKNILNILENSENIDFDLIKFAIRCDFSSFMDFNLIGEEHLFFKSRNEVQIIYPVFYPHSVIELKETESKYYEMVGKIFRFFVTANLQNNCLEILPYNESLIFLKDECGNYDFIFKNMRDKLFIHDIYGEHLSNKYVPKSSDDYHFERWLYFEFKGNELIERHNSETYFYENGGELKNYPGVDKILKKYLLDKGIYISPVKPAKLTKGYFSVLLNGIKYCVSNLITIKDFIEFQKANSEYFEQRKQLNDVDLLHSVNYETNQDLPVCVNWYDANAYASWISKTKHIPVRLLNQSEYFALADNFIDENIDLSYIESKLKEYNNNEKLNRLALNLNNGLDKYNQTYSILKEAIEIKDNIDIFRKYGKMIQHIKWIDMFILSNYDENCFKTTDVSPLYWILPDEKKINYHPDYMSEEDFQESKLCFDKSKLEWKKFDNGLIFLTSRRFGEWLDGKGICVAVNRLESIHGFSEPVRESFPAGSTGKYKSHKIGFRLCYLEE